MQIDIIVRPETIKASEGKNKVKRSKKRITKEEQEEMKMSKSMGTKVALVSYASYAALDNAKQFANYFLSDIDRKAGDSTASIKINSDIARVKRSLGITAGIVAGAKLGSGAGPIGVIVGGAAGATASISSIMWERAGNNRDYKFDRFKDDHSQAVMQSRSGISIYNGRQR